MLCYKLFWFGLVNFWWRNSKRRKITRLRTYLSGRSRKAYKLNSDVEQAAQRSPQLEGVCTTCAPCLSQVANGFHRLKHQGTELKKRKNCLPNLKHPERSHYINAIAQNEWIQGNIFDCMANYLFCQECAVKALGVSKRLTHQQQVKRKAFQHPIRKVTKFEIESEELKPFIVMPEGLTIPWWKSLPVDWCMLSLRMAWSLWLNVNHR